MKVYIEMVMLLNFMLDFMILYGTKKILRRKGKISRLIFSSFFGSFTIIFLWIPINKIVLIFFKILLCLFMNIIAFGRLKMLENTFYFYLLSIILGGFMDLLHLNQNYYLNMILILILCPILFYLFINEYKKYKDNQIQSYQVKIFSQNHEYLFDGFIDTGNHLKSPISRRPVILIDRYIPHHNTYFIPYKALNYEGLLECMKPDKILINEVEIQQCLVGISKQSLNVHDCNCILPNCIKEEL